MKFLTWDEVVPWFQDKTVAVVGSGPGVQDNHPNFIENHDVVVRVNNYKTSTEAGMRTDVFYSFFGTSIRKPIPDLNYNKVQLCMCKLPNSRPIESDWHIRKGKLEGIDYKYIYEHRKNWWFCDTFIPDDDRFLAKFNLLGKHQPTTGFSAILDVLECEPRSVYLTGFDFFLSGLHNVNERWKLNNPDDPIGHRPDLEASWLRGHATKYPLTFDKRLRVALEKPNDHHPSYVAALAANAV